MPEITHENKIGSAAGTAVEENVNRNFAGETSEVGLYLAMSRQAQREGLSEIAEVLKTIALEEAAHAARFAELNGLISESTKENMEKMLEGECGANMKKMEASHLAHKNGVSEAASVFAEASRDEGRHARCLEGLLKKYF